MKRIFELVVLVGVEPMLGFLWLLAIGLLATVACVQYLDPADQRDYGQWAAFWLGMGLGFPLCGYFIAKALRSDRLENGEAVALFLLGVLVFVLVRIFVGIPNSQRTATYTTRTLALPSEWYMANVAVGLTAAILSVSYIVMFVKNTSTAEKLYPWIGIGIFVLSLLIDQIRGVGVKPKI